MQKVFAVMIASGFLLVFPLMADEIAVSGEDELVKTKGSFKEVWVHPEADLSRYDGLFAWQPVFQFRETEDVRRTISRSALLSGRYTSAPIDESSRVTFEEIVTEAVLKELKRSKQFEVVDAVKPGTLIVRGSWLDIVSVVPPSSPSIRDVYLSHVGEATFVFELIDAETGVIQARVSERRRIQPPSRMNRVSTVPANRVTVFNDVRIWAADVARDLRKALDKAKKTADKQAEANAEAKN